MSNDPKQVSGVNASKEEAMEVAEAARETERQLSPRSHCAVSRAA